MMKSAVLEQACRLALCYFLFTSALSGLSTTNMSSATWPMFRANVRGTGTLDTQGVQKFQRVKWKFKAASKISGSAVVGSRAVYFGDWKGNIYALGRDHGNLLWKVAIARSITSTPALVDDLLYVAGNDSKVYVFEAESGRAKAILDTRPANYSWHLGMWASPVINGGVLYIGNRQGRFVAIDLKKQTVIWDHQHRNWIMGSAAVASGMVYLGRMDHHIWAFDALTGVVKWNVETGTSVLSSPSYADGTVYCGSQDMNMYALDALTGKEKWRFETEGWVESSPAISEGTVYYGSYDNHLYANDAKTGDLRWKFAAGNHIVASPAVVRRTVYFGSYDGNFYALDSQTGKELWRFAAEGGVLSSPAVVDGVVYGGSTSGDFYALE